MAILSKLEDVIVAQTLIIDFLKEKFDRLNQIIQLSGTETAKQEAELHALEVEARCTEMMK